MPNGDETPPQAPPALGIGDILTQEFEEPSQLDKVLELMLDPRYIAHHTDLTRYEAVKAGRIAALARKYDLDFLRSSLFEVLCHRNSTSRGGRKEIVKMATRMDSMGEDAARPGMFGRMFGGGGRRR